MAGFTSLALLLLVGALALGAFASPVHVRVSEEAISLNAPERTVAFRGSGFLINYYAGVTQTLILKGLLMATSPVSGQSGGAIIAVLHAAGFTPSQVLGFFGELYTACSVRYEGCHNGFVNLFVEESLQKYLPSNIAEILNAKNVKIGLSQVNSSNVHLGGSAPWVVSKYLNKADVISALLGSAHIPFGTAPSAFKIFRNNPVIDGTYAIDYEQLCPWGNTTTPKCLKIAPSTLDLLQTKRATRRAALCLRALDAHYPCAQIQSPQSSTRQAVSLWTNGPSQASRTKAARHGRT